MKLIDLSDYPYFELYQGDKVEILINGVSRGFFNIPSDCKFYNIPIYGKFEYDDFPI